MFKTRTIDQFKVYQFLKERFELEHFLVAPLSRSALLLEDRDSEKMAFACVDGNVREIQIPKPPDPEDVRAFWRQFKTLDPKPCLKNFEDITVWWLNHSNPLTYQMALNLPTDLYRHFLGHKVLEDEEAYLLAQKGLVTETEYLDIRLWYWNGHFNSHWLGPLGVDGTGNIYGLTCRCGKSDARQMPFYVLDDYYRCMNHLPD